MKYKIILHVNADIEPQY